MDQGAVPVQSLAPAAGIKCTINENVLFSVQDMITWTEFFLYLVTVLNILGSISQG